MIQLISAWVKDYWAWIFILSLITIIASTASILALIIYLPPDYFTRKKRVSSVKNPVLRALLLILKNVFGIIALVTGVVMLFMPGQGILTILVGVILCDFPGKRKLELKLIDRPLVLSTMNRIRSRCNRPPIVLEDSVKTEKKLDSRGDW